MAQHKFVEVQPFEYQYPTGQFPRLITYFGFKFSKRLTQEIIKAIIEDLETEKEVTVVQNPNGLLVWQYEGKPLIAIDKNNNRIFTTQGAINYYGIDDCQKQAAYVLQILRKYGFAKFTGYVIKYEPYRLGGTPKERELTRQALERLANNKRCRVPLGLKPKLKGIKMHAEIRYAMNYQRIISKIEKKNKQNKQVLRTNTQHSHTNYTL